MVMLSSPRQKTILVVEDNEDVRDLVAAVLRGAGYDVCEAENGRDALDQLDKMPTLPCLLLLDLMMPVMSGPELLQTLTAQNRLAQLPVVVISAGGQPSQAPEARRFLRKPTDPKLLLSVVRDVCGGP